MVDRVRLTVVGKHLGDGPGSKLMLFAFSRRPLRCILVIFCVPYVPPLLLPVSIDVAVKLAVNESVPREGSTTV
jgi:hypothetical protein